MSIENFRKKDPADVVLLPAWDVQTYMNVNLRTHTWKHATHNTPVNLPSDAGQRGDVLSGFIAPVESPDWDAYTTHCQVTKQRMQAIMDSLVGHDTDPFLSQLRNAIEDAAGTASGAAEEAGVTLSGDVWKRIADGISVLSCSAPDDGWGNVSDVSVLARIHSPATPGSVDVRFHFHHRTRIHGVDYDYALASRVNAHPTPSPCAYNSNNLDIDSRSAITVSELRAAHDVPFGAAPSSMDVTLGGGAGLREMALLMLASIGIIFNVAWDNEEAEDDNDGYLGSAGPGGLCSESAGQKLGLSAAHLREVCGILPVTGDVTELLDGSKDEDRDSDDNDDDFHYERHRNDRDVEDCRLQ